MEIPEDGTEVFDQTQPDEDTNEVSATELQVQTKTWLFFLLGSSVYRIVTTPSTDRQSSTRNHGIPSNSSPFSFEVSPVSRPC